MSEIIDTEELPDDIFLMNLKRIGYYQQKDPRIKGKYYMGAYYKGSFSRGSNINLILITCDDKIVIPSKLQSYVLH